ncbi:23S rRNA (guanosine(2251)-2'-O)-methyltransferase RlmB [Ectothiorhodospiraceae bacterium BW-2]|nr:23S rRNA (guanosine(2251)-2'-O)-methyltransferase RlmB [Ectothiorhodospiraceae bacterium BW-2]
MSSTIRLLLGRHAVEGALARQPEQLIQLWFDSRLTPPLAALEQQVVALGIRCHRVSRQELTKLAASERHQGVVAELKAHPLGGERELERWLAQLPSAPLLLFLDGVQDPHNLGACLRTAAAAAVAGVIFPKDRSCGLTPAVSKVASGAVEQLVLFQVTNLVRSMALCQQAGVWLVGTTLHQQAASLYQLDMRGPIGIVMGGEGRGLRRLTAEQCDYLVEIPMPGAIESLNVSVASGIVLFEAVRQRLQQGG